MRIFITKWFARFSRKERIDWERLREAVVRAECGQVDAELGGQLIKQRVARQGEGRSGGYRTVIAYHTKTRSVFLYGFSKSQLQNISAADLEDLKKMASVFLSMNEKELAKALAEGELAEVTYDDEKTKEIS